jgi:hypothetical protein
MVEFPPYMKLVVNRPTRGESPARRGGERSAEAGSPAPSAGSDSVSLVRRENRAATCCDVPTALEAERALMKLARDLPNLSGEEAGGIHSGLDRRVILSLLAPLMDS